MREIKFRAQGRASGNWYYGYFAYQNNHYCIVEENGDIIGVDPKTVGQYTGLKDSEGQEIYEGDILQKTKKKERGPKITVIGIVEWDKMFRGWRAKTIDTKNHAYLKEGSIWCGKKVNGNICNFQKSKVIGNKHESPELLKEANDE